MPDASSAKDLREEFAKLGVEQRESLAAMAKDNDTKPVVNAFVVVLTQQGGAVAHADPSMLDKYDAKPCSIEQILAACHLVTDDIVASKAGQVTMAYLQQQAVAAAEQAKNQQLLAQMQSGQNGHHR